MMYEAGMAKMRVLIEHFELHAAFWGLYNVMPYPASGVYCKTYDELHEPFPSRKIVSRDMLWVSASGLSMIAQT